MATVSCVGMGWLHGWECKMNILLPSVCGCLGAQFGEPHCPCTMRRLGLPPSPERLAYITRCDTDEYKAEQAALWGELKSKFDGRGSDDGN